MTNSIPDSSVCRLLSAGAMEDYQTFLHTKRVVAHPAGMEIPLPALPAALFPFQEALVKWALRKGHANGSHSRTGGGAGRTIQSRLSDMLAGSPETPLGVGITPHADYTPLGMWESHIFVGVPQ